MINLLNKRSLLGRLMLRILAIGVIAAVITFAVINIQIDRSLQLLRDQTVEEQAQTIANYLKPGKSVNKLVLSLPDHIRVFYAKAGPSYQYIIRDDQGGILFRSPFAYNGFFPSDIAHGIPQKFEFRGPAEHEYVGFTLEYPFDGRKYYVQAAQTRQAADMVSDRISDIFMTRLLWLGIPFYAALFWIIITTLKRSFQPLYKAADEVSQMTVTNPDFQIAEGSTPEEIAPFIRAVNFSFRRLSRSIQEQRELTENLAHELRTPLSVLKAHIELLGHGEKEQKLSQDVDSMIKLVNQMLDMTRLEYADTIEMKELDLAALVSQVCQDLWPLFLKSGRELRVHGVNRSVPIMGDKDLIYRAVRNLLDNALAHSPARTPVDVVVDGLAVHVRDYGRPIPANFREKIFSRFHRGNGKGRTTQAGAGLGLSIVQKTMEVHGGRATLETMPAEGNVFSLKFTKNAPPAEKLAQVRFQ
ncbi:MAG: sensor histidine kinase [Alphaproteobacteria bacterium]